MVIVLTVTEIFEIAELRSGQDPVEDIRNDPLVVEMADSLRHYCAVTRESFPITGRINDLLLIGKKFR